MAKLLRRGRGEGSIYEDKARKLWVGQILKGVGEDGKPKRKKLYAKSKAELLQKMNEERGKGFTAVDRITVAQWLTQWTTDILPGRIDGDTLRDYKDHCTKRINPLIGHVQLEKLHPSHVDRLYRDWHKSETVSTSQASKAATVLTMALKDAARHRLIGTNPAREIRKPKHKRQEMKCWTSAEVKRFLHANRSDPYYALYDLALNSGMRKGELFGLQWGDINFEDGFVTVSRSLKYRGGEFVLKEPKTARSKRRIDLPPATLKSLSEHLKKQMASGLAAKPVFCGPRGAFQRPSNFDRRHFYKAIQRAGVQPIRFHDMRHTHASNLLADGAPVKDVSERLGHTSIVITIDYYGHCMPGSQAGLASRLVKLFG